MRNQRGITLVEIMVALLLVSIAAAFTFGIQIRASGAFRDQATVAELQQTMRAVSDLLVKELRYAGYRALEVWTSGSPMPPVAGNGFYAIQVENGAGGYGSDVLRIQYGSEEKLARILPASGPYATAFATVDTVGGFQPNDIAIASDRLATSPLTLNRGCVVQITGTVTGPPAVLQYAPVLPWNTVGNPQCALLNVDWNFGYVSFSRAMLRTYRVKPGDQRGLLEMSPSATVVANDWIPLAVGIVDLQVAIRLFQPGDATDSDGDGDPLRD